MPARHGCFRLKEDGPLFLNFGILGVYLGVYHPRTITSRILRERAHYLYSHAYETVRRLAFSLDSFQQAVNKWEHIYALPMEEWSNHLDQVVQGTVESGQVRISQAVVRPTKKPRYLVAFNVHARIMNSPKVCAFYRHVLGSGTARS